MLRSNMLTFVKYKKHSVQTLQWPKKYVDTIQDEYKSVLYN